ncbi:MAG: CBM21 domain-containing protein [Deltaproteobacteria bacterium]|nr:CBM21 domain-containing protein [Deltaproteobacteria bacterium]
MSAMFPIRPAASVLLVLGLAIAPACAVDNPAPATEVATDPLRFPTAEAGVRFLGSQIVAAAGRDALAVDVAVRNTSYEKHVGLRAKIDGGAWFDVEGTYLAPIDARTERWQIVQPLAPGWRHVDFAVFFRDVDGVTRWDNNRQHDFAIDASDVVHRTGDQLGADFAVDLEVRNLAYDKACWVVASSTSWVSSAYLTAHYVGPTARPGVEHWRAEFQPGDPSVAPTFRIDGGIDYAVTCQMNGATYWDNNHGGDYRAEHAPPPVVRWSRPFNGAQRAALAADGTTFVISSEQWISVYAPDGSWRRAVDLGAPISAVEYLPHANLLLVRIGASLTALALDGNVAWTAPIAPDAVTVYGTTAEYVVTRGGAAMLGAHAPVILGPPQGCDVDDQVDPDNTTFPVVAPSGRLACRVAGGVAVFDLATGAATTLAIDGYPYAATDDALIVRAADRRALAAYDWSGNPRWAQADLYLAPDASKYGWGRQCGNHASAGIVIALDQDPGFGDPARHGYRGFDAATGEQRFFALAGEFAYGACPDRDGAFWATHTPYKYGWSADRISTRGTVASYPVAISSRVFGASRDGAVARRDWMYAMDRGRLVVDDAFDREIFSRGYFSGKPDDVAIAVENGRVVVVEPGGITQYAFE